nr:MAG TPA: hypothetical protein [Caudoviricetes sp.]
MRFSNVNILLIPRVSLLDLYSLDCSEFYILLM